MNNVHEPSPLSAADKELIKGVSDHLDVFVSTETLSKRRISKDLNINRHYLVTGNLIRQSLTNLFRLLRYFAKKNPQQFSSEWTSIGEHISEMADIYDETLLLTRERTDRFH